MTYLEVNQMHTNNTQLIIQRKREIEGTLVFDDENLRGGFAQVPNVVLYDLVLGANEKLCYILLLSFAWQKESCFPSQKLLAEKMCCTTRTAIKALKELQKHKLIRVERPGQGKPNIYHICKLNQGYLPKQFSDKGQSF